MPGTKNTREFLQGSLVAEKTWDADEFKWKLTGLYVGPTTEPAKLEDLLGDDWMGVVQSQSSTLLYLNTFSMGDGEETICHMTFDDGTYVVGEGESLRGYQEYYRGHDGRDAWKAYVRAMNDSMVDWIEGPDGTYDDGNDYAIGDWSGE